MILLITGIPGTGKTFISKKIKNDFQKVLYINLTEFAKKNKEVIEEEDKAFQTLIVNENKLFKILKEYILSNKDKYNIIIIDGHFSHLFADYITNLKDFDIIIFHLKADPNILADRLKQRRYPYHKIWENIQAQTYLIIDEEIQNLSNKKVKIYEIDSTNINRAYNKIKELIKGHIQQWNRSSFTQDSANSS